MATAYARWNLSTQSRSTLKMQRSEPSIDLVFAGGTVSKRVGPPLAASFRDLWRPLGVRILSSLFSLLSSLFSLSSWSCDASIPRGGTPTRLMTNPVSSVAVVQNSNVWPSLLSSLCSLLSLLSSLFSCCCSFLRSHFAPVPSTFASGHRRRPQML